MTKEAETALTGPAESLHSHSVAEDVVTGSELVCADVNIVLQPQSGHNVLSTADLPWVHQNHHFSSLSVNLENMETPLHNF